MSKLYFPSLRGNMGDWVYYPCLMRLKDIAERVRVAEEIYESKGLSDMLQRELRKKRGKEIKEYLLNQNQRFFNSLVIAVYSGEPNWVRLEKIEATDRIQDLNNQDIPEEVVENIGVLIFSGEERLFTLDGQHRLIGIRQAVQENPKVGEEKLSVIFIAHRTDKMGKARSRRLFTTLNKNAKPVSKGEIIALDEDDTMAITVRRLIIEHPLFKNERISFKATTNLSPNDYTSLTTIANLYDLLAILFIRIIGKNKKGERRRLTTMRLRDEELRSYYDKTCQYFKLLTKTFNPLKEFLEAKDLETVVKKYRHPNGGNILFRPLGLSIVTEIIAKLSKKCTLEDCVKRTSKIPLELSEIPYNRVIWQPANQNIYNKGKSLALRLLLYMLNEEDEIDKEKLIKDYSNMLDEPIEKVTLPSKLYDDN